MKDALAVKELTDQAAQLRAALTAARAKSTAESGAAGQRAQIMQIIQELNALRAEHAASVDDTQVTLSL
jgi:superfamily I DNA and RNA helicase